MSDEQSTFLTNTRIQAAAVAALVLLSVFLAVEVAQGLKAYRYIGGGVPVSNTITVTGEGEIFAVPDIATFSFTVTEEKLSAADAQNASADKVNAALAYLKEQGIDEKDIKTVGYNVYPRYEYEQKACSQFGCPPGERVLKGFEASQTVSVKVRKTEVAGALLAGVGKTGVSNVSGLEFTFDDDERLKGEARKAAITNAKERAATLARDLGVKLVRVVSFSEANGGYPIYYTKTAMDGYGRGGAEAAPEVPAGENKIVSQVHITYEIR